MAELFASGRIKKAEKKTPSELLESSCFQALVIRHCCQRQEALKYIKAFETFLIERDFHVHYYYMYKQIEDAGIQDEQEEAYAYLVDKRSSQRMGQKRAYEDFCYSNPDGSS